MWLDLNVDLCDAKRSDCDVVCIAWQQPQDGNQTNPNCSYVFIFYRVGWLLEYLQLPHSKKDSPKTTSSSTSTSTTPTTTTTSTTTSSTTTRTTSQLAGSPRKNPLQRNDTTTNDQNQEILFPSIRPFRLPITPYQRQHLMSWGIRH